MECTLSIEQSVFFKDTCISQIDLKIIGITDLSDMDLSDMDWPDVDLLNVGYSSCSLLFCTFQHSYSGKTSIFSK